MPPAVPQDSATSVRTCPFCAESIRAAAKVCPRCRQWLTWRSLRHPWINLGVGLAGLVGAFAILSLTVFTALGRLFNGTPDYQQHPDALAVLSSNHHWVQTKDGPRLFVTGILTNRSAFPWRDIEFECRFYDAGGTLIDATSPRSYLTIRTNDDAAFRVTVNPAAPTNAYDHFTLTVTHARNLRAAF